MHCDRSAPVPPSAKPVISQGVSSSAPKLISSKRSLTHIPTNDTAAGKWSGDSHSRRRCSAEEIEQKKQDAQRRRRALAQKM